MAPTTNTIEPQNERPFWLRKRWAVFALIAIIFAHLSFSVEEGVLLWVPSSDQNLTSDQISNTTLKRNAFFSELLFRDEVLLSKMALLFEGHYYPPRSKIQQRGEFPNFLIVENGSCRIIPNSQEEEFHFRLEFSHGDSIGGLNLMYGHLNDHDLETTITGAFVWIASADAIRELLNSNVVLAGALERKFLRSLIEKRSKRPIIFFPGFASTQLIAWKPKKCFGTSIDIGDRVWLNIEKVLHQNLFEEHCFVKCMSLDILEQTDPVDCKLRPEEGGNAIYELAPGLLSPFTTIFRQIVFGLARNFGYDIGNLIAIPYDWRLAPGLLQQRDKFFSRVKQQIEHAVQLNRNPSIALCHSMGCKVFLFFIEFMKKTHPDDWEVWVDKHIWMHVSVASPFLGASQAVKGYLSGLTFSLPMDSADSRLMGKTWSSGYWLLPYNVSNHKSMPPLDPFSSWPDKLVTVLHDSGNTSFGISQIVSGEMFSELAKLLDDDDFNTFRTCMNRYYTNNTLFNPIDQNSGGVERPPIKKILAIYGTNVNTELHHIFRVGRYHDKKALVIDEEIFEGPGGAFFSKPASVLSSYKLLPHMKPLYSKSGDGVVPYASLSWVNSWHYDNLTITHVNSTQRIDLDVLLNKLDENIAQLGRNFQQSNLLQLVNQVEPAYTKYSSSFLDEDGDSHDLTVIEVEAVSHRDIIRDDFLLKQIEEELYWQARQEFLRNRNHNGDSSAQAQDTHIDANDLNRKKYPQPIAQLEDILKQFSTRAKEIASPLLNLFSLSDKKPQKPDTDNYKPPVDPDDELAFDKAIEEDIEAREEL